MKSITAKKINKIYDNRVHAVKDVDFNINAGEFIVVMGHSGSGKSTFLQIAGLLDTPTSGNISVNGIQTENLDSNSLADIRMQNLGFVFQAFHLNPHLKAYENVMLPMLINNSFKSSKDMVKRAKELICLVGLKERMEHYPGELSGGEQQRVAIARAMANNPDFILADEPTGNLDSDNEEIIFKQLKQLTKDGKGVLVVSHNDGIIDYADKIFTMKDGVMEEKENGNKD